MGGPAPSVQFSWDGPGALGAGDDGKALCWDQSSGRFVLTAKAAAAHTHAPSDISQGGATSGQALLWDGAAWTPATLPEGVTDHGALSGLEDDDHARYYDNLITTRGSAAVAARNAPSLGANVFGTLMSFNRQIANLESTTIEFIRWRETSSSTLSFVYTAGWGLGYGFVRYPTDTTSVYGWDRSTFVNAGTIQVGGSAGNPACLVVGQVAEPKVTINTITSSHRGLLIKGVASQSANLLELQNSSASVLFAVGPAGQIKTAQTAANTNTPSGATARQLPLYNESGTLLGYVPVYGSAW